MTIALITGASRGLGRSMAEHLAAKGVDILFTYRSRKDEADALIAHLAAQGRKAYGLQLDTGVVASFPAFVAEVKTALATQFGRSDFDYLINNAGIGGAHAPLSETTEAQFDELMNIHFKGVLFLTQGLLPLIKDGGRILNVSTGLARFTLPGYGAYAAMKGAIEVMSRYLAKELGPRGIRVNVVAPGAIETDFGGGRVRDNADLNAFVASQTALGRVGLPDDIGAVVTAILSDEMGWMTAQRIEVSGGMFL
jgi:NAD(P)-dependent dehydrogenase (short-subunit alcohol dehydrogenase family)